MQYLKRKEKKRLARFKTRKGGLGKRPPWIENPKGRSRQKIGEKAWSW